MNETPRKNLSKELLESYRVKPGQPVQLGTVDPTATGPFERKKRARAELELLRDELVELQECFYAWDKRSLLIVLQAMDTGGKDGAIEHVMKGTNPQGVEVTSFKVPTAEELSHDYLWRVHKATPARRMIGIFNRSHYEDVLVVRVHSLVPEEVWSQRYEQIREFEELLAANGTVILKFYLHISKDEQARRLQARLDDPNKRWKFAKGDLKERALWDDYMAAYADALNRTSTEDAPWYVVPANHKWYRNLVIMSILVDTLKSLNPTYPDPEEGLDDVVIE
ncbi:MAG: polyphosphate kinase 2 family protein [Caldilineales bacterium]|nr:polyphosphate kinase 2 family protein [Caldilineales bacterium]